MYVAQWLHAHARLRPDHPAILDAESGTVLSYDTLNRAAYAQALRLQEMGVGMGDRVALISSNRPEVLEIMFACARLGAIMVPMNTRLSLREQERILEDCTPRVVLVEPCFETPQFEGAMCLQLLRPEGLPHDRPVPEPNFGVLDPEMPLLILYTGGTTGVPKGAVLTHRSIQWNAWNTISGWGLRTDDVAPVFTPMFHTGGLNVLATPLFCLGATVVLPGPFDAERSLDLIEEYGCTLVFMVPTMFQMLLRAPNFRAERLGKVRSFISGGAPCPKPLFDAMWDLGLPFRQGYGLTEAGPNTFGVTVPDAQRKVGTVGSPLPHVRIRLQRADGNEAAPGEVGEVLVSGGHVMAGYWNRPEDSAKVMKDGWLHTGDLAFRDEEGFYFICGRSKEMYISGGENVFPAEVEEVLLEHPAILEAAVIGVPHAHWGEVGRAYLVLRPGMTLEAEEVAEFCHSRMARYKTPKEVRFVTELPKSPAGKLLKRLLTESVPA